MDILSLAFRTDLTVLRLAGSTISDRGSHLVVRTPENPTYWWGNFVIIAAPPAGADAPGWRALFDREFPGAAHVAIGLDGTDGWAPAQHALARIGLVAEVSSVLGAEWLRAPPHINREARCRPLAGDRDWAAALELTLALAHEAGEHSPAHEEFARRRVAETRRVAEAGHGWRFGAFLDGVLRSSLGIVIDEAGLARYQSVETHPDWRRRGLAGTLVHLAGTCALARGADTLVIVAEAQGAAIRLYRSLGFAQREHQVQLSARPA